MIDFVQVSLGMSICSLLVCVFIFAYTLIQGRKDKLHNKIYLIIIGILAFNSISGIATGLLDPFKGVMDAAFSALQIFRQIYFLTHTALCPMFFLYVASLTGILFSRRKFWPLSMIPFLITELLVFLNPFFHWVWYYDEHRMSHRSWGEGLIYLAAIFYYVGAIVIFSKTWKVIAVKRRAALLYFFMIVALGVLIQLVYSQIKVEVFFEVLGFFGVMMAIENEDDRIDEDLGLYNRTALSYDLRGALRNSRSMQMIVIRMKSVGAISQQIESENTKQISKLVGEYLCTLTRKFYIYAANPSTYVLTLFDVNEQEALEKARMISARFHNPWRYEDLTVQLSATLLLADFHSRVSDIAEAFYMIDSAIPKNNTKQILYGEDLDYLLRRAAVERAVTHGLEKGSFEVYYQPTYHLNRKLHGAEALLRMHDDEIGNIYPDEFIPIAEHLGLIDEIDDFVLEEVCRFAQTGIPMKNGMESINVNLSVLQCMKEGFTSSIKEIVEKYNVPKEFIHFEITESVAASDYALLSRVISELKEEGFSFSIDDYGTGYSNMTAVFSLDIDVIKIDKSILWGALYDQTGSIILENNIHMIRQMNRKILVEGVETEEQIHLLEKLGVDYLQGFYFSKAVPKEEFIRLIGGED